MGRYLSRRVVHLLRNYLTFCNVCGFVIFTYNDEKDTFRTAKWRRRVNYFFGSFYLLIGVPFICLSAFLHLRMGKNNTAVIVSTLTAHLNIIYIAVLQRYRVAELQELLNSFSKILKQVHSITHRRIIFNRIFALRSVVRFIPMMIIVLGVLTLNITLTYVSLTFVAKLLPDVLVEMMHHSVYIALYIVAQMYDNLNMALSRSRMDKSEKFSDTYLKLYRFTEELHKLLAGYFFLHFVMNLIMVSALTVQMLLNRSLPLSMLYVAASSVNKIRCLMFVADEISERSKFYQKVGRCSIEFYFIQINFKFYCLYRIDKKMFLRTFATLAAYTFVANRYIEFVHK